jgi:vacuolar-type H+-ATPase subunit E/Vma4
MNGLVKVIDHIRSESEAQCKEIIRNATEECARIRAEYSQKEQDEYWKYVNNGTKEVEERIEQLSSLANLEAHKMLNATHQEMLDEVFALAAKKLRELPERDYKAVLKRLKLNADCSAEDLVALYKEKMTKNILSALFD